MAKKTDVFSLRLEPKLRYAASLAAHKDRRTLSSLMEWALDRATREIEVSKGVSAAQVADQTWDDHEAVRILRTGKAFPHLLTTEECAIYQLIMHHYTKRGHVALAEVRTDWQTIKDTAKGSPSTLRQKL